MILSWNGCRFEVDCSSLQKDIPQKAGFHWDRRCSKWWTGRLDVADKLSLYADERAKKRLNQAEQQVIASRAVDANIEIPAPKGLSYLGFQKAAASFALSRKDTLISDSMGLGKTIESIAVINADPSIKNVLIICPASLKLNWMRELQKWVVKELTGEIASGKDFPKTDIVIVNYEQVKKFKKDVEKREWDLLIADEIHMCKNSDAIRTRQVLGWASESGKTIILPIDAKRRIYMTGTPILNRPIELWPLLRVVDPEGLGASYWAYAKRYCSLWESPWGWDARGATKENLPELQTRLRQNFMIRRTKEQVLTELPPKRRQIITIPGDGAKAAIKAENDFYLRNENIIEEAKLEAEISQSLGDEVSFKTATEKLKGAKKLLFEEMSRLRHDSSLALLPYAVDYLANKLEEQDKIVVGTYHRDITEQLFDKFKKTAVMMHGGTSLSARQAAVDRFQTDSSCNAIIGTIGTMGVGWTLTAASYALLVSCDWVPALLWQFEDRIHRIGQSRGILIQYLCFDNSLDASMLKKVLEKQEGIELALDR